jgi:hypothetical protein
MMVREESPLPLPMATGSPFIIIDSEDLASGLQKMNLLTRENEFVLLL